MRKANSERGDLVFFICLLSLLVLTMFGALSYLESQQGEEEPIVITSDQVQSFLRILSNYSSGNQQSASSSDSAIVQSPSLLDNSESINGTFGYNVDNSSYPLNFSHVKYAEISVSQPLVREKVKKCSSPTNGRLLDYMCSRQHTILFSIRNPNGRIKVGSHFYYSVRVIRFFKSTSALKKALQKGMIIFMSNDDPNETTSISDQFKRGHVYLVTVTLDNNLPIITNCDLKLDWGTLPFEVKSSTMALFERPSSSCSLYNFKVRSSPLAG